MSAGLVGAAFALTLAAPARAGETPTAATPDVRSAPTAHARSAPAAETRSAPAADRRHAPALGWRLTPTGTDARFRGLGGGERRTA